MTFIQNITATGNFRDVSVLTQTTYFKTQKTVIVMNGSKRLLVCLPIASVDK
jgi:hypothetical protein